MNFLHLQLLTDEQSMHLVSIMHIAKMLHLTISYTKLVEYCSNMKAYHHKDSSCRRGKNSGISFHLANTTLLPLPTYKEDVFSLFIIKNVS